MAKSADQKVQEFIDGVMMLDDTKYQILKQLRAIVFDNFPETKEKMMYGGIIFSHNEDFGGVFVYKKHVSFEFSNGYLFEDPEKVLEGGGKYRRHIKLKSLEDIEAKKVDFYVKQALVE